MTNPLLAPWDTPFKLPPFDMIDDEDFAPALEEALTAHNIEIASIIEEQSEPTFENTIAALEASGEALDRVLSPFFALAGADATPRRQELQREFSPKLAKHFADISGNAALFARIKAVWDQRGTLGLDEQDARQLFLVHRGYVRSGAALTGTQANRMKAIKERLAVLGTEFSQNLLKDESNWSMDLAESDLVGLPSFLIDAARAAGDEKGNSGPIITLSRSLIVPFLQFSPRRELRKKAWEAWVSRGAFGGETDNRAIAAEILALREERAKLLGYENFARYKLETEMAGEPAAVRQLLMDVWEPAKAQALADQDVLSAMAAKEGVNGPIEGWDWRFYAEKRRKAEHDLDEATLKSYFQLDKMIEAAFECSNRLFGLEFSRLSIGSYHPDVRSWEVTRDGQHVAIFLGDYFARGTKRSGAWCSAMRSQAVRPRQQSPVVINVCNFAKPPKGQAALLSYDDARTLFHEFGHALHQMLSDVRWEGVSGTSVARDFVELPSQLFEHWLEVPEVLEKFAVHVDTGEAMPKEMLDKVLGAANFDMGFQTVEYVGSALVDLEFHDGPAPADPMAKQAAILAELGMPSAIPMRHATPQFAHVFSGDGYSSGYYSYMWSEVMDADAFAAFEEAGGAFDPEIAKSLEENILSKGGSVEAAELYEKFRGRLPGVEALLKGRGLTA